MSLRNEKVDRNFYARLCFLEIADDDYLSARLLYRNGFKTQALVLFQQAVEKYIKAILLFNDISTGKKNREGHLQSSHNIERLLKLCGDGLRLLAENKGTLVKLSGIEEARYRAESYAVDETDNLLPSLDIAIVDLRRYCRPDSLGKFNELNENDRLVFREGRQLFHQRLEEVIKATQPKYNESWIKHETWQQRDALIWRNSLFDGKVHKDSRTFGYNSPFAASSNPRELYMAIKDYVKLPSSIHKEYQIDDSFDE